MTERAVPRPENYLQELVFIFFAQRKIILSVFGLLLLVAVLVAVLWPPVFAAEGALLVKGKKSEPDPDSLESFELRPAELTEEHLNSEVQIFTSDEVFLSAIESLRDASGALPPLGPPTVKQRVAALAAPLLKLLRGAPEPQGDPLQLAWFNTLVEALSIKVVPTSTVIAVRLRWKDPARAEQLLQLLMDAYLERRRAVLEPAELGRVFARHVDDYIEELNAKQAAQLALIGERNAPEPADEITNNLWLKRTLQETLVRIEHTRLEHEAELEQLASALANEEAQFFAFVENETIRALATELKVLQAAYDEILLQYKADSETALAVREKLDKSRRALVDEVRGIELGLNTRLNMLTQQMALARAEIESIDRRNVELKALELELASLRRDSELLALSFETFFKRREQSNLSDEQRSGGVNSEVSILSRARVLSSPVFPKKKLLVGFGLLVGLIVGLTAGFIAEYFDRTFKRPIDVTRITGLPVLLTIPQHPGLDARPVMR